MTQVKTKNKTDNFSVLQILGGLLLVFAVADFALSWMGVNLTQFYYWKEYFCPIILPFS